MSDREDGRLWYSHGPEDYTTLHFTDDEAEKAAQDEMQYYRDCAEGDLWHEDIDVLSWGEMIPHGKAQCVKRSPAPEGAHYDEEEDWQLVRLPVAEPAHDPLACPCCRAAGEIEAEAMALVLSHEGHIARLEARILELEETLEKIRLGADEREPGRSMGELARAALAGGAEDAEDSDGDIAREGSFERVKDLLDGTTARVAEERIAVLEASLAECVARLHDCARLLQDTIPGNEVWCEPCGLGDQVDATLDRAEALLEGTK